LRPVGRDAKRETRKGPGKVLGTAKHKKVKFEKKGGPEGRGEEKSGKITFGQSIRNRFEKCTT